MSTFAKETAVSLTDDQLKKLTRLGQALVDQEKARVIVPPQQNSTGFWFGGGNMIESAEGDLFVVGRYRNFGDSRTGIGAGERGLELAIFKSTDRGETFEKVASWNKSDLDVSDCKVLSIEGSALHWTDHGVELFVSTEKDEIGYPEGFEGYLKPGTGVWTIDKLFAETIDGLRKSSPEPFWSSDDPNHVHIKDPFVYDSGSGEATVFFCTHPFSWSSSNTGFIDSERQNDVVYDFISRGASWDVAMTRGTCLIDVPMTGVFEDLDVTLMFYDGGECVRNLDEHKSAVSRPRGYSCEELGGLGYFTGGNLSEIERLSRYSPLFISPHGTGCSRYVDVLSTGEGMYATWQQAQQDGSQPLVMNFLSQDEIEQILG